MDCDLGWENSSGYADHRERWIKIYGPIPPGLEVMHTCPNKNCRSIRHLKLGTHSENMKEARDAGNLKPRGKAKMMSQRDREFILEMKGHITHREMAEILGFSIDTIRSFLYGKSWQ